MEVFRQLKQFYEKDVKKLVLSIIFLAIATAVGMLYPKLIQYLIDDVIRDKDFTYLPQLSLGVVLVMLLKGSFQYTHSFLGARVGNRVAYNMRNACYNKLQELSFQYYDRAKTGDLMSRLTADLEAIRIFIGMGFAQLLNIGFMVVFALITMLTINWKIALVVLFIMPVMAITAIRFESRVHPAFRTIRRSMANLTTAVQENITGMRTVKSFAREPHEVEKFYQRNEHYRDNHVETSKIWAKFFPSMEFIANFSFILVVLTGGYLIIVDQSMELGELVACFTLLWFLIGPMWGLGFQINMYTQSKASAERVLEVLHQKVHIHNRPDAIDLSANQVKGEVSFRNVTFHYPDNKPAVRDISFEASEGKVIGLLGGTGAGKSTIIQLLMRAYDNQQGEILLDGVNIKNIKLESLRQQIAVVFQETFLFSSTIRNNLAYGNDDVSMETIIRAAKLADAHEFIMEMPEGYDTIVGERGMGLSGGQKQRIAIARALIKDPKILVLDDATSAVDMETEHQIQAGFKEVMKGRTTFIIAHRISSLKHADEILVLDHGEIVQRGTHHQLLREPGLYLDTYNIQYADRPEQINSKDRRWAN